MCAVMIDRTPAAMAARNGTISRRSSRARSASTAGTSRWESCEVAPWPGKCFAHAATPASCRPFTAAVMCRATSSGSEPNARVPMIGLSSAVFTSADGAKSRLTPAPRSSAPSERCTRQVVPGSSRAPSAALPGYGLPVSCASRVTSPPSSSMETSVSAAARSSAVSAVSWPVPGTLPLMAKRVTPLTPRSSPSKTQRGAAAPGNGTSRVALTSRSRERSLTGRSPRLGRRSASLALIAHHSRYVLPGDRPAPIGRSSLHRPRDQAGDHAALDEEEEGDDREGEQRGCGHDRAPVVAGPPEEELQHDRQSGLVLILEERVREDQFVPGRDEGEDDRRDQGGRDEWQQNAEEDPDRPGAVDRGGVLELLGHRGDEPAQHPDAE